MDKFYYNFKPFNFQWLKPGLALNNWEIGPNEGRITFKAHPLHFFTGPALNFLNKLDIHVDDFCILLLGIPPGMAVQIHTDYIEQDENNPRYHRGHWSLNVPIGTEEVYTMWYDGPARNTGNQVYTEEQAGNLIHEAVIEKPNICRTNIPHRVDNRGTKTTWRVCLRCRAPIRSWDDAVNLLGPYLEM